MTIHHDLETVRTELRKVMKVQPEQKSHKHLGSTSVFNFRDRAVEAKKRLTIKQTADFIIKRAPELKTRLEGSEKMVVTMRDMSAEAFEAKHGIAFLKNPAEEQMTRVGTSMLLNMALESRYASVGLYRSYREKVDSTSIKLDTDLINDKIAELESMQSRNSVIVRYRVVIPWQSNPQTPLEIVIEGPYELEKSQQKSVLSSTKDRGFVEACYAALMNATAEFKVQCRAEQYSFRSTVPSDKMISFSAAELSPLTSLLYELDVNISEEPGASFQAFTYRADLLTSKMSTALSFPRTQRIKLAYKLIQCGLLISGTPWLSSLENKIVKRTPKRGNDDYHFILDLSREAEASDEGTLAAISQHLFAVGILLVELGLGRVVTRPTWARNNRALYPDLMIGSPRNDAGSNESMMESWRWQRLLAKHMGDDFTLAAEYCLERKTDDCWYNVHRKDTEPAVRDKAYLEILQGYYLGAYLP